MLEKYILSVGLRTLKMEEINSQRVIRILIAEMYKWIKDPEGF